MKKRKLLIPMLCAAVLSVALFAEEQTAGVEVAPENGINRIQKIETVRLIAATMPGDALNDWMTQGALKKWNEMYAGLIQADGSSAILEDFFSQALVFAGPQTDLSGIYAFYNPLQDNILLIQTDNADRIPRIEDFAFMTGQDFRGEELKEEEYPQAIAPTKEMLDAVLVQNTAAVAKIFRSNFPVTAKTFSLREYRNQKDAPEKIAFNAGLRLALLKNFTLPEAETAAETAGEIALHLWNSGLPELKEYFRCPAGEDALFLQSYSTLPENIRASMFPVLFLQNKQETIFGFSSRLMPELIVLVKVAADGNSKPLFVAIPLNEPFVTETNAIMK